MKVCLLGYQENFFWTGSATLKVQKNVHKWLNQASVDADLFVCSESKNVFSVLFDSLNLTNTPEGKIISGGVIPFLMYLKRNKYDVTHMIVIRNYMVIVALLSKVLRLKLCVTFHDTLNFPILRKFNFITIKSFFVNWILTKTSQLIFLFNESDVKVFKLKFENKKAAIVKNGVEEKYFKTVNPISSRQNILFAGGINKTYKGFNFLTNALKKMKSKSELLICGYGEIENIKQNNLGQLSPEQFKSTLEKVLALIIPSEYDSFNISGLEAMACGTPIIISNRCGLSRYLTNGEGCFIVEFDDDTTLAQRIDELLQDKSLWNKISREARVVAHNFLWSKVISDYKKNYFTITAC